MWDNGFFKYDTLRVVSVSLNANCIHASKKANDNICIIKLHASVRNVSLLDNKSGTLTNMKHWY